MSDDSTTEAALPNIVKSAHGLATTSDLALQT